jgi:hypothetical protein
MRRVCGAALAALSAAVLLAACGKQEAAPTVLPTKQSTIDRVHDGLKKADDEAARRREAIDAAAK